MDIMISNYKKVHYDAVSDVIVMQVNTRENTFVRVTQKPFNMDMLELLAIATKEHQLAIKRTLPALDTIPSKVSI